MFGRADFISTNLVVYLVPELKEDTHFYKKLYGVVAFVTS